ncbi:YhgE/Pip family protein [Carnobacterium divergens]
MKNEWKKLAGNKLLLISFVVIMFIPILYAGFFLKSVWDPYGKTGELPVAVVNLDESVDYQGKTLDVGDQLVENLKKNDLLDWHFVSEKAAKEGIKDRKYYMVVTLPKNFSKNASTLLDKEPKKMNITYETNGSLNYIGEVIGETAAKQLKSEVSANVTKAYAESIFGQIEKVGDGFTQAADGSKKLDDGTKQLTDGNKQITENLQKLASSTVTFSEGAEKLEVGLNQYTDGVAQLDSGATKLNDGIGQLASNVGPLQAGVGQLSDGSQTLANGVGAYTAGVGQLADGSNQLVANNGKLQAGVAQLNGGVDQLANGVQEMSNKIDPKKLAELSQLIKVLPKLNDGIDELQTQLANSGTIDQSKIEEDLTTIGTNLGGIKEDLTTIETNLGEIKEDLTNKDGIRDDLTNLGNQIQENPTKTVTAIQKTAAYQSLSDAEKQELDNAVKTELGTQAQTQGATATAIGEKATAIGGKATAIGEKATAIGGKAAAAGEATQATGADIQTLAAGLTAQLSQLKAGVDKLAAVSNVALPGATSATQGLIDIKTALDQQLAPGLGQIQNGLKGDTGLVSGINAYTNGVASLKSGSQQLTANSSALNSGANALNGGIGQISGKLPDLISGVTQLNDGSSQLAQGTAKLTENSPQLNSGIGQLADGSTQIQSGSSQLADGSGTLGTGLGTLKDGTKELSSKLKDGAKEVNGITATDKTFDMLASPDKLTHKEYSHVENYGAALAPYVLSLALYVGALVFNFIFPIRKISMTGQSSFSWWLSKFSIGLVAAVAMAVVEAGLILALGLHVESVAQFMTMAIVTSIAYMFLIMTLAMTFDNPGRFIGMVLLIVQLGGAGGTFPIPLTNNFFKAIHPYLPMSHSIYGFREAISGGLGQGVFVSSALILLAIFVVFSGLLFLSMNWLQKRHLEDVSQLDDNQKLQALED